MLTRDAILASKDLTITTLAVPEWGGEVGVRAMTGAERDSFEGAMLAAKEKAAIPNLRAELCARCLCDSTGAALFTAADVTALGGKSAAALGRVFDAAAKLNGIGNTEVAALGEALSAAPSDASGSV